jgi:hypothetical protein
MFNLEDKCSMFLQNISICPPHYTSHHFAILMTCQQHGFKGSCSRLRRLIKDLGLRRKMIRTSKGVLTERHDIQSMCVLYLVAFRTHEAKGGTIISEDKTYIHGSHARPKSWINNKDSSSLTPPSKGKRLIVIHAG